MLHTSGTQERAERRQPTHPSAPLVSLVPLARLCYGENHIALYLGASPCDGCSADVVRSRWHAQQVVARTETPIRGCVDVNACSSVREFASRLQFKSLNIQLFKVKYQVLHRSPPYKGGGILHPARLDEIPEGQVPRSHDSQAPIATEYMRTRVKFQGTPLKNRFLQAIAGLLRPIERETGNRHNPRREVPDHVRDGCGYANRARLRARHVQP